MDIFVISISDADNIKPELLEGFRHKEFKNREKQKTHSFSYLMADRILREFYKIENREIEFTDGKPYLKSLDKYFSISHSGKYILIGFSDSECGVDIEQIKNRDYIAIAERMKFNVSNQEEFYAEWTKYEAQYKLGEKYASVWQTKFENYMLTAVSQNAQEKFEIYIQNGEKFSNAETPVF